MRDLIAKGSMCKEPCKVDCDRHLSLLCESVDQYAFAACIWSYNDKGGKVIRTGVVPCLSSGFAKNNNCYVHVCPIFAVFCLFVFFSFWKAFFSKISRQTLQQSSQTDAFSQFFKGTTSKQQLF